MTWYFDPAGETFDLYAPDGTQVASDVPFSGSWADYPDPLPDEARRAIAALDLDVETATGISWTAELAAEDIEQGTP
jgi:hypothetical protein